MARASFKNLPGLERKLKELREKTRGQMEVALARVGDNVTAQMKSRAEWKHVADSIGWTFGNSPAYSIKVAQAKAGTLKITIYAGNTNVRTATWLEFGTAPHENKGIFAGTWHPGTPARPFFFPTWRLMRKEVKAMLRKALREAVREAVR